MHQQLLNFDSPAIAEIQHVAQQTSQPPPADQGTMAAPLVRPDRQLVYGGYDHSEWPDAASVEDHDTIAVDRIHEDIDGPVHRLLIQRGDVVEVFCASERCEVGEVVDINHDRRQVRVRFPWTQGNWVAVSDVYPSREAPPESYRFGADPTQILEHVDGPQEAASHEPQSAVVQTPYTWDELKAFYAAEAVTFGRFQNEFQRIWDSQDALRDELVSRFKASQLKRLAAGLGAFAAQRSTKEQNASSIVRRMLSSFVLDGSVSYSPLSGETYEAALYKKVLGYTADDYAEHLGKEQAKASAQAKALTNPETLLEFRTFVDNNGDAALNDEQLARYDCLRADLQRDLRAARQANSTVQQYESEALQSLTFVRKAGYHEKRECPLYIVQLESRVEREAFNELNRKAKQLGGWYSSFKKSHAGFQFLDQSQADRFCELLTGDVNRADILEARKERKELSAAECLHELANNLFVRADEAIERSDASLQNTARRADIQAGVRGRALADQALSRTLHSLAEALSRGEAKYLDGIRQKTQLETLETVLHLAKWARIRAVKREERESTHRHGERQRSVEEEPIGPATIRFAEFPYPTIYKRHLEEAVQQGRLTKGVKQAAETLRKFVTASPADFIEFARDPEIEALGKFVDRAQTAGIDVARIRQSLDNYQRLVRANITCLPELRAALREYLEHRAERRGDDPVRIAERELIGRDLPGFFPTPRPVLKQILERADIERHHRVLEPSCGKGDILDALKELHPGLSIHAVEQNRALQDVLAAKGHAVEFADFLEHQGTYDRIVMNPPFDADSEHVQHAYALLAPAGRLVSVMSEGPFFRNDTKSAAFRNWLAAVGGESEKLPADAFQGKEAFRQTGVRTRLVTIHKAGGGR